MPQQLSSSLLLNVGDYMMPSELSAIRKPSLKSAAPIASVLSQAGVAAAIWGLRAAVLYGGDLVPLDIELIVHDEDQERAFIILTSHGLLPSLPDDSDRPLHPYTNFVNRRQEYASPSQYRDRRRLRHVAPIYETPPHPADSDPKTTFTPRMFIILNSAEFAGLAPFSSQHDDSPGDTRFISLTALQKSTDIPNCLVPTSQSLVESEIHVLLQDPNHPSPTWCQNAAQLASLVYSRSCPGSMDGLADFVSPQFQPFASWFQRSQNGMSNHGALRRIQKDFWEPGKSSKSSFYCMA